MSIVQDGGGSHNLVGQQAQTHAIDLVEKCNLHSGFFIHNQQLWASASEPTGSMPTTQSPERKVGTITLWPQARAC